jgi:hypothetical protein
MTLVFDNLYAALGERFYVSLKPDPLPDPVSVITNDDALKDVGLPDLWPLYTSCRI